MWLGVLVKSLIIPSSECFQQIFLFNLVSFLARPAVSPRRLECHPTVFDLHILSWLYCFYARFLIIIFRGMQELFKLGSLHKIVFMGYMVYVSQLFLFNFIAKHWATFSTVPAIPQEIRRKTRCQCTGRGPAQRKLRAQPQLPPNFAPGRLSSLRTP